MLTLEDLNKVALLVREAVVKNGFDPFQNSIKPLIEDAFGKDFAEAFCEKTNKLYCGDYETLKQLGIEIGNL